MITALTFTTQQEKHLEKIAPALGIHFELTCQGMTGATYRLTYESPNDLFYLGSLISADVTLERMHQPSRELSN